MAGLVQWRWANGSRCTVCSELYQRQIEIERVEIANAPAEEAEELALIYQARGLDETQAPHHGRGSCKMMRTHCKRWPAKNWVSTQKRWAALPEAAITSFLLFAVGAIIPVFPFMFLSGMAAVITSLIFSTIGLFAIGAGITLFTGRSLLSSGGRQVLFGLAAAAITYPIGRLIWVNVGGYGIGAVYGHWWSNREPCG